jgi:hypothetical protein
MDASRPRSQRPNPSLPVALCALLVGASSVAGAARGRKVHAARSPRWATATQAPREPARAAAPAVHFIEVGEFSAAAGETEAARRLHERLATALAHTSGLTLDVAAEARDRLFLDGRITRLAATPLDDGGRVRVDCDARAIVGALPERSIKLMLSVGGSLEATSDPRDLAAARAACVADMADQIAERLQAYFDTQR